MRKQFCYIMMLLLLSAPTAAVAAETGPLYVLDGRPGVDFDSLPPAQEVLYTTVLDSAEAVAVYGPRAAGGAVVVVTVDYARLRQEASAYEEETREDRLRKRMERRRTRRAIICALTLLFVGIEEYRKKRAARKPMPMSDEDYRRVQEGNPKPIVPESLALDPLFAEAAMYVVATRHASIADLQRFFGVDYQHALNLIMQLEERKVIARADGPDSRDVLIRDLAELRPLFEQWGILWTAPDSSSVF